MGYNVIDIINKCIYIENHRRDRLISMNNKENISMKLKIIIKVFLKDIDRIINYYNQLKKNVKVEELQEIDFRTYDKISFLINEYIMTIDSININVYSVKEYLKISLELAKDKYSLFIDLQGRLYNNTKDNHYKTYEILSEIIKYTQSHINMIEKTIK